MSGDQSGEFVCGSWPASRVKKNKRKTAKQRPQNFKTKVMQYIRALFD